MKTSKQARREAKELFRSCQVSGLLDEARVRQAIGLMIEKKPRGYFGILTRFQRLVELDIARRTATIESAVPLAAEAKAGVQANLNRIYGTGLSIGFAENTGLIGGMRVRVGSDVYDGTVLGRLNALQEQF